MGSFYSLFHQVTFLHTTTPSRMAEFQHLLVTVVAAALSVVEVGLKGLFTAFVFFRTNFPEYTALFLGLLGLYVAYKITRRMVTMWVLMLIAVIKTVLVVLVVALCSVVYFRGAERFFNRDVPFVVSFMKSPQALFYRSALGDFYENSPLHSWLSQEEQAYVSGEFERAASDPYGYAKKNMGRVNAYVEKHGTEDVYKFANEQARHVNRYLAEHGIDLNVGQFL